MKTTLFALIIVFSCSIAYADDWKEDCQAWSELAEVIMQNRQSGVEIDKMISALKANGAQETSERMVIEAYDTPRFSTEEHIKRSISEFKSRVYVDCAKTKMRQSQKPKQSKSAAL